jgi:hypothetical protein
LIPQARPRADQSSEDAYDEGDCKINEIYRIHTSSLLAPLAMSREKSGSKNHARVIHRFRHGLCSSEVKKEKRI